MRRIPAKDAGTKGIGRAVGKGDGLLDGTGWLHDKAYRREEFNLSDAHRGVDINYQGRAEVVAGRIRWVLKATAAGDEMGALRNGFADEGFEIVEVNGRDAGTYINRRVLGFFG